MRTLMLLRHAATEDSRPGHRDEARRLTRDGEKQAAQVGDRLRREDVQIDVVLCSSATRARQTVEAMRMTAPVVVTDRLYRVGGDDILNLIRDLDDRVEHVLVVGHSPSLPAVAHQLADPGASDPEALDTLERRFPACALATLSVDGTWADLDRAALISIRLP
ncbi:MAG: SixA phosphatase family protein [Kineosporiaceae bacterium]